MGNDVWNMALQNYGPLGLGFVFSGFLVFMILKHFIKRDERKDADIVKMTTQFSASFDKNTETVQANTSAMHELKEAMLRVCAASDKMVGGLSTLDKAQAKNTEEHERILTYVKGRARA